MCGIAGGPNAVHRGEAQRMLDRLAHRGPDDEGEVTCAGGWLGHRRLSIVDVDGGRQPLSTATAERWLVGNGEIYNHEEVHADLGGRAYATRSDNEVALHLLDTRGPSALGELEGMFAVLCAGADGSFVAARDPVGIKPLYWAEGENGMRFASEMHAFDPELMPRVEAFPPRVLLDPRRGARSVRRCRAARSCAGPRRARPDDSGSHRHPRGHRRLRAPPDDGRCARRRLPLRRPRLDADSGHRRPPPRRERRQAADLRGRPRGQPRSSRRAASGRLPGHRSLRADIRRGGRHRGRGPGRAGDRALRPLFGAQRCAELPLGRDDRSPREGGADGRGRGRALRGLLLPARLRRRGRAAHRARADPTSCCGARSRSSATAAEPRRC